MNLPESFTALRGYEKSQLVKDLIAGLIVAIIALPLSIALAIASGVDPARGIYTAIAAGFLVSFLGGSRVQIAGPTAAFATIVAGIVAEKGMSGLFLATAMAGVLLILMGLFKLGSLIRFIPYTITTGFTAGIAVTIFIGQIKDFLGLRYAEGVAPIETIEKLEANLHAASTFHWQALLVGAVSLLILIFYPRFEKRIPPSLVAVVVGALMVRFIPVLGDGVFTIGELYEIPMGLPKTDFSGIDWSLSNLIALLPDAATIALLAGIESLLSCVVADQMIHSRHNSNTELMAQGVANIGSVLFGGIPATGAIARTAANVKNGGKTPVAGMVHAVVLLLVLLFLMPLAGLIPMPTIAAILFVVAYNMSEWRKMVKIVRTAPFHDILVALLTFLLTVIFDLVVAIAVGLVLAVVLFMKQMSDRTEIIVWKKTVDNGKILPEGTEVYEIVGPLFFGSSGKLREIAPKEDTKTMILRMKGVPALDSTAMNELDSLYSLCKSRNVRLLLSHVNESPRKIMEKSGFAQRIGKESFCDHIDTALALAGSLITD